MTEEPRENETRGFDFARARQQIEWLTGVANYVVGLTLTLGGLGLAVYWRVKYGGYGSLKSFYLYTAWAFGALQLLAGMAMVRRWAIRWILQMIPMIVPILAYQYFIMRFIFRRL